VYDGSPLSQMIKFNSSDYAELSHVPPGEISHILSLGILLVMYVPFCVFFFFVLFCVLFVCKCLRGVIQNIPDMCRHLYSSCGSAKHRSQETKMWIPVSSTKFCGYCVKTCEDVAPNLGEKRPGCFTMTTQRLTLLSSPSSFWRKNIWLSSPTHRTPIIWHPVTSSYFQKWNWSWEDSGLITLSSSHIELINLYATNSTR
jgi:hypothetical protein